MPRLLHNEAVMLAAKPKKRAKVYGIAKPGMKTWVNKGRDFETTEYLVHNLRYGVTRGDMIPVNLEYEKKVLAAVCGVLKTPERWAKGALCRLRNGRSWPRPEDPQVACWCIVGALDLVKSKNYTVLGPHADRVYNKLNAAVRKIGFRCIETFNDDPRITHDHLQKLLGKCLTTYGDL